MQRDKKECLTFIIDQEKKQKRKVAESDQQIRRCRDRRKLGQVCSVPADARNSPVFSCKLFIVGIVLLKQ